MTKSLKIGILQTGLVPDEMRERHGDYDDMFARFLGGYGFTFEGTRVVGGHFPASVNDADGWLITGSKFGAYEDLPWIPPLEDFIRSAFQAGIPQLGVCFGHQIMAQALGGKVEKFGGGWIVGKQRYQFDGKDKPVDLLAWHQDQVVELPPGAVPIASAPDCRYAALRYDNKALSVQPHPEFDPAFVKDLFVARKEILPPQVMARQRDDHEEPLANRLIADMMAQFLLQSKDGTPKS